MNAPDFSFSDSLQPLNRRQEPIFQTGRGNYATTWIFGAFWNEKEPNNYGETALEWTDTTTPPYAPIDVLLFGSDVPFLATLILNQVLVPSYSEQLAEWIASLSSLSAIDTWARLPPVGPPPIPQKPPYTGIGLPSPPSGSPPAVCPSRVATVYRPSTLATSWNATDAGQGSLVVTQTEQAANVQGFPLRLDAPICGQEAQTEYRAFCRLLVGFESPINHGLQDSLQSIFGAPQPIYRPIILRRSDYTEAIRANKNVINTTVPGGPASLKVVGLWA